MQALTPAENLNKSCAHVTLRKWQTRFISEFESKNKKDFLLVALPGSGKTIAALTAINRWMLNSPERRRVLFVVPTDNLREQWKYEAHNLGIEIATTEFVSDYTSFAPGRYDGASTTYQSVAQNPEVFRCLMAQWEFVVVFDEIHHAGDQSTWGESIRRAFENVGKRLCMSGTPFRSDKTMIPFLTYDGQLNCNPDFSYDYPDAIRDGVIRVVEFSRYSGVVTERNIYTGDETAFEVKCNQSDEDASKALTKLLQTELWQKDMLRLANERLNAVRVYMPDAGGLALAKDIYHAAKIKHMLETISGEHVDIVVSEGEVSTTSVREFKNNKTKWIVAVRQVSEGTDIPRLMVLAYLTNYCTELFFKQAVGRIVRKRTDFDFDGQSYCFIPDHPKLIQYARHIDIAQTRACEMPDDDETEAGTVTEREPATESSSVLESYRPEHEGNIIEGSDHSPEQAAYYQRLAELAGCTVAVVARLERIKASETVLPSIESEPCIVKPRTSPRENRIAELKKKANSATSRAVKKASGEFALIRSKANKYAESFGLTRNDPAYYDKVMQYLKKL